jgi:hypothetical protein
MRQLPTLAELKETGFWILAILGAAALVYDVAWYGGIVARVH